MNTDTISADPVLAGLPAHAQAKFARLKRVESRAQAMANGLATQYEEAREAFSAAQSALAHFDRRHGHRVADDDPARASLLAQVEEAKAELRRVGEERAGATGAGFSTTDILAWLRAQGPRARFKVLDTKVRLPKGERAAEAYETNRQAQIAVREQIATAQNAPRLRAELRRAFRDQLAALASSGAPQLRDDGSIEWPLTQVVTAAEGTATVAAIPDAVGLLLWALGPDAITKRLDAELARTPEAPDALTEADQRAAIAQGEAELLRLQREGEALAELLEGDGIAVNRNGTPIPVLLGVEVQ